jgi:hypothetical protein
VRLFDQLQHLPQALALGVNAEQVDSENPKSLLVALRIEQSKPYSHELPVPFEDMVGEDNVSKGREFNHRPWWSVQRYVALALHKDHWLAR